MKRLLIIRLGALGDVIMAAPMLHALWERHPECRVDWLVGKVAAPILETIADPRLRLVRADERDLFRGSPLQRLRAILGAWTGLGLHRYDRILILNADPRYGILPLWCRGPRSWFRPGKERGAVPGRHHSAEYVRMLTGIDDSAMATPAYPPLQLPPLAPVISKSLEGSRRVVAISPAGAKNVMREEGLRRWPLEGYRTVARALRAEGHRVVLVGGPGDEWCSREMASDCDLDLVGKLDLPAFLSLLSSVHLLVTHDSGPLHMADFVGTASVGIFGPTLAEEKWPIATPFRTVVAAGKLPCRPCYDGRRYAECTDPRCMTGIAPEDVLERIRTLLD